MLDTSFGCWKASLEQVCKSEPYFGIALRHLFRDRFPKPVLGALSDTCFGLVFRTQFWCHSKGVPGMASVLHTRICCIVAPLLLPELDSAGFAPQRDGDARRRPPPLVVSDSDTQNRIGFRALIWVRNSLLILGLRSDP